MAATCRIGKSQHVHTTRLRRENCRATCFARLTSTIPRRSLDASAIHPQFSNMARSQTTATSKTTTKKRKSTGDIDEGRSKQAKQPRRTLDTFFAPQVPATSCPDEETGKIEHVALNDEQIRVLKMVVDEEKNVFFTGSAGAYRPCLTTRRRGPSAEAPCFFC